MNWLLKFLPADVKALVMLGRSILASVDSAKERREVVSFGIAMLADGKVTPGEWSHFGSLLHVLRQPRKGRPPKNTDPD